MARTICNACLTEVQADASACHCGQVRPPLTGQWETDGLLGTTVGALEILEILGAGGFARVYRAHHRMLNSPRALKVCWSSDPHSQDRFREEAALQIRFRGHRNIVSCFDLLVVDDGPNIRAAMVLEYADGGNLEDAVWPTDEESRCFDVDRAIRLGLGIASALERAHRDGVLHRDLKPLNVLLAGTGADERALLTDFGVATRLPDGKSWKFTRNQLGTVVYMAPEQLDLKEVSKRTDIYALGCVLHYALTGRPPYEAPAGVRTDAASGLVAIRRQQQAHLSAGPLPSVLTPSLAGLRLDRVVSAMLSTDASARPQSVSEVADQLRSAHLPVEVPTVPIAWPPGPDVGPAPLSVGTQRADAVSVDPGSIVRLRDLARAELDRRRGSLPGAERPVEPTEPVSMEAILGGSPPGLDAQPRAGPGADAGAASAQGEPSAVGDGQSDRGEAGQDPWGIVGRDSAGRVLIGPNRPVQAERLQDPDPAASVGEGVCVLVEHTVVDGDSAQSILDLIDASDEHFHGGGIGQASLRRVGPPIAALPPVTPHNQRASSVEPKKDSVSSDGKADQSGDWHVAASHQAPAATGRRLSATQIETPLARANRRKGTGSAPEARRRVEDVAGHRAGRAARRWPRPSRTELVYACAVVGALLIPVGVIASMASSGDGGRQTTGDAGLSVPGELVGPFVGRDQPGPPRAVRYGTPRRGARPVFDAGVPGTMDAPSAPGADSPGHPTADAAAPGSPTDTPSTSLGPSVSWSYSLSGMVQVRMPGAAEDTQLWIQETEVTQAAWAARMGSQPSLHDCPLCPVERVNLVDAMMYANRLSRAEGLPECYTLPLRPPGLEWGGCEDRQWVCEPKWRPTVDPTAGCQGYRVPTRTAWSAAASQRVSHTSSRFVPGGEPRSRLDAVAWYAVTATDKKSHPVATRDPRPPSDMLGNVAEWVEDSLGPKTGLVCGGNFTQSAKYVGPDKCEPIKWWKRSADIGFRLVRLIRVAGCPSDSMAALPDLDGDGVGDICPPGDSTAASGDEAGAPSPVRVAASPIHVQPDPNDRKEGIHVQPAATDNTGCAVTGPRRAAVGWVKRR